MTNNQQLMTQKNPSVSIIMGSDSDLPTIQGVIAVWEEFGIERSHRLVGWVTDLYKRVMGDRFHE